MHRNLARSYQLSALEIVFNLQSNNKLDAYACQDVSNGN